MNFRIIRNDISKSKLITTATVFFVAVAAMLVSLATILIVNLSSSIDTLMTQAKTPHFLQMHSGELDRARLDKFAQADSRVADYQVLEFINLEGSQIVINDTSFSDSIQDNGVSVQSEQFDFLLDLNGKPIRPSDGELYVPISYMKDGTARIGDKATVAGKQLTVAGFVRDSQMNSTLSSSKRFLVGSSDYATIKNSGIVEYLIEFRLTELSYLGAFETDYASAGLESNGPTITYPLFRMINALTDGLMIAILILVSILVVIVAFLCIRFTLLAKIEQDTREIGVMKAIGLRVGDIKKIYLAKYIAISLVGSLLGYLLSLLFQGSLSENIRLYMGTSEAAGYAPLIGIIGIVLVFFVIVLYVNSVLNRLRKISATRAIRFGDTSERIATTKHFLLSKNTLYSVNVFLGLKDILARRKLFFTMFLILLISSVIMVIPHNIATTIADKSFVSYLGIGQSDLIINIQQTNDIISKSASVEKFVSTDNEINKYTILTTKVFSVASADDSSRSIKIELGDHTIFPVAYVKGTAPKHSTDIALSSLNASDLGKNVGDILTVAASNRTIDLTVTGIYSDVTNGGKTAKASFADESANVVWSVLYASLTDKSSIERKVSEYERRFGFTKVSSIATHTQQMFGSAIASIQTSAQVAIAVALSLAFLITLLFMKMLLAKDRRTVAILYAWGFTRLDIVVQYTARALCIAGLAIVLGTMLANTLGVWLTSQFMSQIGAVSVRFVVDPLRIYVLFPILMTGIVMIATVIATTNSKNSSLSEDIKE